MLYPKEDKVNLQLTYQCRTCSYKENAQGHCVYRNQLSTTAAETAGVTTDVGSDPTVGSISSCEIESWATDQGLLLATALKQTMPEVLRNRGGIFPESAANGGNKDGKDTGTREVF